MPPDFTRHQLKVKDEGRRVNAISAKSFLLPPPSFHLLSHQFQNPFFRRLGYITWLVMLAMALVFFRERAFFMDAGFQLFNLINEEHFQLYHYRFVTGIPQIIPLILVKTGAPLSVVAMSFSASYILFFLLVYHLLVRYLKNDFLGWVLVGLFTFISLDTFYHMQSEFYLGLALLLLSFGVVLRWAEMGQDDRKKNQKTMALPLAALLVTVGFSHKLSLVFFGFLWAFFWLSKKEIRKWWYYAFLVFFLAVAAVKSIYFTNWYEAAKQADFQNNLNQYFPHLHTLPSNLVFLKRCILYYYMLPILLGVVSVFYFWKKSWLKLLMVWGGTLGFLLLYNISDPTAAFRFYSEVTYLPLIIFVAVPLFFDVLPYFEKIKWLPYLLAGTIVFRLTVIVFNHHVFENKFTWIERKLEEGKTLGTNRLLMLSADAPQDTLLMEWGTPFSAMHLSALKNPKAAATILVKPNFDWYKDKMERTDVFFSYFDKILEKKELNRRYYDMTDGKYILIK